jgi:hypothetical protein
VRIWRISFVQKRKKQEICLPELVLPNLKHNIPWPRPPPYIKTIFEKTLSAIRALKALAYGFYTRAGARGSPFFQKKLKKRSKQKFAQHSFSSEGSKKKRKTKKKKMPSPRLLSCGRGPPPGPAEANQIRWGGNVSRYVP